MLLYLFFFFKQKTAYELRISDWSSDVCSSDLSRSRPSPIASADSDPVARSPPLEALPFKGRVGRGWVPPPPDGNSKTRRSALWRDRRGLEIRSPPSALLRGIRAPRQPPAAASIADFRTEEHKSELPSLMRISYA